MLTDVVHAWVTPTTVVLVIGSRPLVNKWETVGPTDQAADGLQNNTNTPTQTTVIHATTPKHVLLMQESKNFLKDNRHRQKPRLKTVASTHADKHTHKDNNLPINLKVHCIGRQG